MIASANARSSGGGRTAQAHAAQRDGDPPVARPVGGDDGPQPLSDHRGVVVPAPRYDSFAESIRAVARSTVRVRERPPHPGPAALQPGGRAEHPQHEVDAEQQERQAAQPDDRAGAGLRAGTGVPQRGRQHSRRQIAGLLVGGERVPGPVSRRSSPPAIRGSATNAAPMVATKTPDSTATVRWPGDAPTDRRSSWLVTGGSVETPCDTTKRPGWWAGALRFEVVEVPGIEPGSFAGLSGLLRAQLAVPLLGPTAHASKLV